jgi:alcohol dehydrogenase
MRLPETFSFVCPLKTNCGSHALDHLPFEMAALGARSPLILADHRRVGKKRLKTVISAFKTSGMTLGVYDRVGKQPRKEMVPVLKKMYQDGGCDCLIAVGSDSVVDTAKCLQAANLGLHLDDAERGENSNGPDQHQPLMLVSTPGGDGYEATGYVRGGGERRLHAPILRPAAVFIDPAMMTGSNEREIVDGALIGLAQAVEAFLDESAGPMCRAYARTAIELIITCLPVALDNEVRRKNLCAVINGQMAAGCAFSAASSSVCLTLADCLGADTHLPLGFILAVLLPHWVEQAGAASPEHAGSLLWPLAGGDAFALTAPNLQVSRCMAILWEFFDGVGAELDCVIPTSLSDAGFDDEQVETALSRITNAQAAKRAARIVDSARSQRFG